MDESLVLLETISLAGLDEIFKTFCLEVTKQDGTEPRTEYNPDSLKVMQAALQHLSDKK